MSKSDGSTADYYELPAGCTELQDLISHRDLNAQLGEIFRACYRYGHASHSDKMRDAKKIRFYADAEVKRLEKLEQQKAGECENWTKPTPRMFKGGPIKDGVMYFNGEQSLPCNSPVRGVYVDPYDEPAASIDDDSARAKIVQQNGEMAAEVYAAIDGAPNWDDAPEWAMWLAGGDIWFWSENKPEWNGKHWRCAGGRFLNRLDRDCRSASGMNTLQARPTKEAI